MPESSIERQDLRGKNALITGASRGIGRAIAKHLALRGCSILGTCSKEATLPLIDSLNKEVQAIYEQAQVKPSPKIFGIVADIYSPDCAAVISNSARAHFNEQINIFVNNAGATSSGEIGNISPEHCQEHFIGNIQTPILIVEEFVKHKIFRPESRIIYISSIGARITQPFQSLYSSTKSAGEALCRTWAEAFGGREEKFAFMAGTTANSVAVGLTETEAITNLPQDLINSFKSQLVPLQSIPRDGKPDDVADVVGMLCSREARWITGSVVNANGGTLYI